jgi:hypothetical protein
MATSTPSLIPALVLPYLAWRVYRRFHRNVGRQLVHTGRLVWGIVVFGAIAALLLFFCLFSSRMLTGIGSGLALGGLLALVGLNLTRFEITPGGPHYYTPNTYIGVALTLLLAGRVLYRMSLLYFSGATAVSSSPALIQSPLTMLIIGLTAGYYIAFNSGVLLRSRRKGA